MYFEYDINLFWSSGFPLLLCFFTISTTLGCLVIRYGPSGEGPMSLVVAVSQNLSLFNLTPYIYLNKHLEFHSSMGIHYRGYLDRYDC